MGDLTETQPATVLTHYFLSGFSTSGRPCARASCRQFTGELGVRGIPDINNAIAACADENMLVFRGYSVIDACPSIAGMKVGYDLVMLGEPL